MEGNKKGSRLARVAEQTFLHQTVDQPKGVNYIQDLVLTADKDLIQPCEEGERLGTYDNHYQ